MTGATNFTQASRAGRSLKVAWADKQIRENAEHESKMGVGCGCSIGAQQKPRNASTCKFARRKIKHGNFFPQLFKSSIHYYSSEKPTAGFALRNWHSAVSEKASLLVVRGSSRSSFRAPSVRLVEWEENCSVRCADDSIYFCTKARLKPMGRGQLQPEVFKRG